MNFEEKREFVFLGHWKEEGVNVRLAGRFELWGNWKLMVLPRDGLCFLLSPGK